MRSQGHAVTPFRLGPEVSGEGSGETLCARVRVLRDRDGGVPGATPGYAVASEPDDVGVAAAHRLEVVEHRVLRRARVAKRERAASRADLIGSHALMPSRISDFPIRGL